MPTELSLIDLWGLGAICLALLAGGILKGATGAGMPILAVPVIATFYDVPTAVIILVIPNLFINLWQIYKFREYNIEPRLLRNFALAGALGAGIGTLMLAWISADVLSVSIAVIIFGYIALRLLKPSFSLPIVIARNLAWPAGIGGGILQGAVGLSGPVAVTFANSIKLDRPVFILLVSVFFAVMCVVQFPVQVAFGMVSWSGVVVGVVSLVPLLIGVHLGEIIGKRMNPIVFDRVILIMLAVLAVKQLI